MHTIIKIAVVSVITPGLSACNAITDSSNPTVASPIVSEQKLPTSWIFAEEFNSTKSLKIFDLERLQRCNYKACKDGFIPAQILTEENGNNFLELSARYGQLSHLGSGNSYRNELGTKMRKYNEFDFQGLELWYGFRVKSPYNITKTGQANIMTNENGNSFISVGDKEDNTFTQIKQVTKIRRPNNKKNCSKGVVFHMNTDGMAYNGDGQNYPTKKWIPDIVTTSWTAYKVGIKFSKDSDGWIKVFKNNDLVWHDDGPNLITNFYKGCNLKNIDLYSNHLRIGVYAKSENTEAVNTLHFDDFVSGDTEEKVDLFHSRTLN